MEKITLSGKIWTLISVFIFSTIVFSTASTSDLVELSITVEDIQNVSCPGETTGAITVNVSGGTGIYSYSWTNTDGTTYAVNDPTITGLGPGSYSVTVTDESGPTVTSAPAIEIIVTDTQPPVITVTPLEQSADLDECTAAITSTTLQNSISVSDNCSAGAPIGTRDDGLALSDSYPIGETTITWNVTDTNGNTADPVEQIIKVIDEQAPVAVAKNIPAYLDETGNVLISPEDVDDGSSDNCDFSLSLSKTDFNCSDLGENPVILTIKDSTGSTDSANALITVIDELAPVITANLIEVPADQGKCEALVTMTATAVDNCDTSSELLGERSDGEDLTAPYPVGTTIITWTANDTSGNSSTLSQEIKVNDEEAPEIKIIPIPITDNIAGECYAEVTINEPVLTEACGIANLTSIRSDGKVLTDPFPVGITEITWKATDVNSNINEVIQYVEVKDVEAPQVPPLPDITTSCAITLSPPTTATDNCTASEDILVTTQDPVTYQPQNNVTEHIIKWRFEDEAGQYVEEYQKLIINPLISTIDVTAVSCNGGSDGTISIEASGGFSPYTYSLNNGAFGTGMIFSGLSKGVYEVRVKDATGCIVQKNVSINEPEALQYQPPTGEWTTPTAESCFGESDGTITINGSITGGNGNYVYLINGQTYNTNPIPGLPAGDYEIFIQDTNGCNLSQFLTATVEGPDMLDARITKKDASCYNTESGSISISNPSGGNSTPYSFRINGGTWQTNSTPTGYQFTNLSAGTYTVEMKDASGCERILETVTITEPEVIIPNVTATRTTTYGSTTGTASADPTGGNNTYTYTWKDADGTVVGNTRSVSGLKAGIYEVIVTDGKLCTGIEQFEIYDKITTEINAISLCKETDDTIRTSTFQVDLEKTLGGEGEAHRFTYIWTFGEGASLPDGTRGIGPHVVSYTSSGDKTVTLTVIDEGGEQIVYTSNHYVGACFEACTSANNFSGDKNSFYLGDINGNKMVTSQCDLSEPMYLWFIVGEKSANGYMLNTEFIYTVSNATSTKQFRATNCYSHPDFDQDGNADILKPGDKVRLNQVGTGDNQIHWECDEVLNIIHITYRWTVNPGKACGQTNNNHCASTNETMSVAAPIRGFADATGTCFKQNDGSIVIDAYGGTNDFKFVAVHDTTGEEFTSDINVINGLPGGTYTVTIIDNKTVAADQEVNYFIIENVVVSESDSGITADIQSTDITCFGEKNGTAQVDNVSGGTPYTTGEPYKYLWNDPDGTTTSFVDNLAPGTYTVTITDAFGCSLLKSVTIDEPVELTPADAGPDQTRCGFTETTLEANMPTSGTGKWSISSKSIGASAEIVDVNDANSIFRGSKGEYILTWTISGSDGCHTEDEVKITIIEDCNYLDFDGVDDYVDMGNNYGFDSGTYSIEAWIKPKAISGTRTILSKRNVSGPAEGYELVVTSTGYPGFKIGNSIITPDGSVPINTQRWYHIAVTFDGAAIKMYVDGLQVRSVTKFSDGRLVTNPEATTASFLIGATYDTSNSNFTKSSTHYKGWIEEVRLWKKALTQKQIQVMMNQRLEKIDTIAYGVSYLGAVKGTELPLLVPGNAEFDPEDPTSNPQFLMWSDLAGYYQLIADEAAVGDGTTSDLSNNPVPGVLKNITTLQVNSAPLPYESVQNGNWRDIETSTTPWRYGRGVWDAPNSLGINQEPIEWNIVRTYDRITSGNQNITVLGLLSEKREHEQALKTDGKFQSHLSILDPNFSPDEYNPGHSLRVTHYLRLNGAVDLVGESQLLQDEGSILEDASTGYIERDQQGTASSYNYNYWSSPVSLTESQNNSGYTVAGVLRDGTVPAKPDLITFGSQYHWADHDYSGNKRISTYWLYTYTNFTSNTYAEWHHVGKDGEIKAGEGFTMKGTSGSASITDRQNYTFVGKPNNGTITHEVSPGNDYLVGNPYPSALDSHEFIKDNILDVGQDDGRRDKNVFNGTLYFWDHFAGKTHYLQRYVGGYATLNLSGGTEAVATDERINATGQHADKALNPRRFIPVGQAFYVSTQLPEELSGLAEVSGGDIKFKNSQRVFETEHQTGDESIFKSKEEKKVQEEKIDKRSKVYLRYSSPEGFHRQILVTEDKNTSKNFDLGYDAPLIEDIDEDMYWMIHDIGFVIQAVPEFSNTTELPLTVKLHTEGEFTIAIDKLENIPADLPIHLKDTLTNVTHDLRKSPFKSKEKAGLIIGRFYLIFPIPEVVENNPEASLATVNSYYSSKESIVTVENPSLAPIQSAILYNLNGQQLKNFGEVPMEKMFQLPIEKRASGVYILKLQMENESKSIKFIVE